MVSQGQQLPQRRSCSTTMTTTTTMMMIWVVLICLALTNNNNNHNHSHNGIPFVTAFNVINRPSYYYYSTKTYRFQRATNRHYYDEGYHSSRLNAVGDNNKNDNGEGDGSTTTTTTDNNADNMDLLTKSSWYAVEWFGKAFGNNSNNKNKSSSSSSTLVDTTRPPTSVQETLSRIQLDNQNAYFLNGQMDVLIYDENCVFADPFVSFRGRDRFVENLSNLGSFITKYDVKVLNTNTNNNSNDNDESSTSTTTTTKFMVKLELNLPWKPILAWPWGVTYEIDHSTYLITSHVESWDIQPLEGVKQIFRKPTTTIASS